MAEARARQFISFRLQGGLYGFEIRMVKEITQAVGITPVPLRVRDVSGVFNLRGQVVVVLDAGVSLGLPEQKVTEDSQIIILKTQGELEAVPDFTGVATGDIGLFPVGFLVESVGDIVTAEPSQLEQAPSNLPPSLRRFVEGVVRLEPRPLVILDPVAILGGGE